ncbi:MAG: patatin-like phospholipase family protein [Rhizobium ruizarguesonis]|uniref:patatin-like phospholipase family protein n=1 Tax=Rhizobium ruizarguesonis TaxID=2081791 RepID=UPI001FE0FC82|nr:patatin-like phospholipase family protein [Rhizobium ruizarguesonis]
MTDDSLGIGMMKTNIRSNLPNPPNALVFGPSFFDAYGDRDWTADNPNMAAAHQFRTELISRVATARLSYGTGVEKRALESIVELFKIAREITAKNVGCGTFEILVWHTLNAVVRPFTAKWHPLSQSGVLDALDASDDFRAELYRIQSALRELERGLALLEGGTTSYNPGVGALGGTQKAEPGDVTWRPAGGNDDFEGLERDAIERRRKTYKVSPRNWAAGLALSGGGIRSATFSLGVLVALSRRNLLPEFDYMSTVSGGGYTGSFLTSLLGQSGLNEGMGLRGDQEPFKRTEQESPFLMGVRQRASFLSAGVIERLLLVMRSTYGVFINVLLAFGAVAFLAAIELFGREITKSLEAATWIGWGFPVAALILLSFVSRQEKLQLNELNVRHFILGGMFCLPLIWKALGEFHYRVTQLTKESGALLEISELSATLLIGAILIALLGAAFAVYANARSVIVSAVTVAVLLFVEHSFFVVFKNQPIFDTTLVLATIAGMTAILWCAVDVNETSLYRYYRSKLATAFICVNGENPSPRVSDFQPELSFYPIVNCALNAPGSKEPKMRGRLADVFSFTPHMTGSNLIGYHDTKLWEVSNPKVDLAAAMALSGAAVSPQMGLRTTRHGSFWLTLFNARLNAWLKKPNPLGKEPSSTQKSWWSRGPGLQYLFREFTPTASEKLPFVNISDGGHIENLGVYELLRRRCRYIVAIDGESDPRMTFHGLTNLQRLAYIDMGIHIDAELDELRLMDSGFSRSHFRFCKVRYPTGDAARPWETGYLLYVKLSLTGNEGEFLRRFRLDEPTFPHHSTADQFFSETQFEAYRSLGEHIGDKLFMEAVVEELAGEPDIAVRDWMKKYVKSFIAQPSINQRV